MNNEGKKPKHLLLGNQWIVECGITLSLWLSFVLEHVVYPFYIQMESRMVVLICLPLYHCPKYHLVAYSLLSLMIPSFKEAQLSPKSCGSKSSSSVCPQPSLPCSRLIPSVA